MTRPTFPLASLAAAALAAGLLGACNTVDLGTPPADVNACRPGPQFFIDQIWPNVLSKDYGGRHCYDSQCHGGGAVNMMRLNVPIEAGAIPFPTDWNDNYTAASNEMNCSNSDASTLLLKPTATVTHGGGMLFLASGPEAALIKMWVSQP